jgi:hypothetical protein
MRSTSLHGQTPARRVVLVLGFGKPLHRPRHHTPSQSRCSRLRRRNQHPRAMFHRQRITLGSEVIALQVPSCCAIPRAEFRWVNCANRGKTRDKLGHHLICVLRSGKLSSAAPAYTHPSSGNSLPFKERLWKQFGKLQRRWLIIRATPGRSWPARLNCLLLGQNR